LGAIIRLYVEGDVALQKIYTKRGDTGQTGLLYGGRVSKSDPRVCAYGVVDEANSMLGMARAFCETTRVKEIIFEVQKDLFTIGAELATDIQKYQTFKLHFSPTTHEMTRHLEDLIDDLFVEVDLPRSFIIPGASSVSATLDVARGILRRAERETTALKEAYLLANEEILRYLNRLSDLLFVLARYEDRNLPYERLTGKWG